MCSGLRMNQCAKRRQLVLCVCMMIWYHNALKPVIAHFKAESSINRFVRLGAPMPFFKTFFPLLLPRPARKAPPGSIQVCILTFRLPVLFKKQFSWLRAPRLCLVCIYRTHYYYLTHILVENRNFLLSYVHTRREQDFFLAYLLKHVCCCSSYVIDHPSDYDTRECRSWPSVRELYRREFMLWIHSSDQRLEITQYESINSIILWIGCKTCTAVLYYYWEGRSKLGKKKKKIEIVNIIKGSVSKPTQKRIHTNILSSTTVKRFKSKLFGLFFFPGVCLIENTASYYNH